MARIEQAIFTILCMVSDGNGNILVEDRLDPDWPGLCLPGGHVEPGESFTAAAIRETFEETGLIIEDPRLCGVKQFQTKENTRYVVFFFKASRYHGTLKSSSEGEVFWMDRNSLAGRRLVPDLEKMLEVFESPVLNEFYYYQEDNGWGSKLL